MQGTLNIQQHYSASEKTSEASVSEVETKVYIPSVEENVSRLNELSSAGQNEND